MRIQFIKCNQSSLLYNKQLLHFGGNVRYLDFEVARHFSHAIKSVKFSNSIMQNYIVWLHIKLKGSKSHTLVVSDRLTCVQSAPKLRHYFSHPNAINDYRELRTGPIGCITMCHTYCSKYA